MTTPRIRSDLQATPAEDQGIQYFDVKDPRSGGSMRLYDFEWRIAAQMDGSRSFEAVASWAHEELGIDPSAAELRAYATALSPLGFFDPPYSAAAAEEPLLELASAAEPLSFEEPRPGAVKDAPADLSLEIEEDLDEDAAAALGSTPMIDDATVAEEGSLTPLPPPAPGEMGSAPPPPAPSAQLRPASSPQPAPQPEREPMPSSSTARTLAPTRPEKRGGMGSALGLVLVMVLVAGVVVYVKVLGPGAAPQVAVQLATPREVVRLYDEPAAAVKAAPAVLAFGEDGKVSDVIAQGTEVKPGMPLATLEGFAKVDKELSDVRDRAAFYEKQLLAAQAKGLAEETKRAEAKVAEKKKLLGELEAHAAKLRLLAPASGSVSKVMVTVGGDGKAGAPAIQLSDDRTTAQFKLPAEDAATLKAGAPVSLTAGEVTLAGRVIKVEGESVAVEVLDNSGAVKLGDSLRLVRGRVPNVVPVPAAALVKMGSEDAVFVLSEGVAQARNVTVVDRTPTEALVSSGLSAGDQVILSPEGLTDGQKVSAQ